ncbi:MAG: hypothetical protein HRU40_03095 [Saprospiraceae bacterium]|nr:hypothetical protein [Saprospiraceae bacterium]
MENLNEALGGLVIITGAILVVYIISKYTYLIKKAMIEKGLLTQQSNQKVKYIDIGCIVIGLSVGLLVSSVFTTMNISEDTMDLLVWGTISFFGGIGLIIAHYLRRKIED